ARRRQAMLLDQSMDAADRLAEDLDEVGHGEPHGVLLHGVLRHASIMPCLPGGPAWSTGIRAPSAYSLCVPVDSRDPVIGRLIDRRYEVGDRIARGGMASVYTGVDLRLDRKVAVKVMH